MGEASIDMHIYLWSFEPFMRTHEPPDDNHCHRASVDKNCPIHARRTSGGSVCQLPNT